MIQKMKSGLKTIVVWGVIFLIASLVMDHIRKPNEPHFAAEQAIQVMGKHHSETLMDISRNQVAVLYFWGSWCGICRYTSPSVQQLYEANIPVVGVAVQSGSDTDVQMYLNKHHWTFPSVNDQTGKVTRIWQIKVTPTLVLIKNGQVIHTTTGLASYWGLRLRVALAQFFI